MDKLNLEIDEQDKFMTEVESEQDKLKLKFL
jgi:hypothetical protein